MTMRRFSHPRGALLLVILALLTMFGLVAVALVVLTQNARRSANVASGIERSSDPPRQLLDDAMRQIVRGSNISPVLATTPSTYCTGSAIGPHSLLETMYGNLAITGTVTNALATVCGNQMWTFTVGSNVAFPSGFDPNTPLAGRVLTMTSGTAALGQSSVIVGVNPPAAGALTYQVMAFENGALPNVNDTFTINGVPFSGAGFGYASTASSTSPYPAGTLSDTSAFTIAGSNPPIALLPGYPVAAYTATNSNPPGGANSDYTAADFQHMLLAAQTPPAGASGLGPLMTPIPSLHRPELIQYWMKQYGITLNMWVGDTGWLSLANNHPDLMRMIMLRPSSGTAAHPNFTGSNPNFNPTWDGVSQAPAGYTTPTWDVDNDGDGVADSVWVDLGMPVRAAADGRLYKPLFAILCVDLDGRLNLNAHGNSFQASGGTQSNGGYSVSSSTEIPYSLGGLPNLGFATAGTFAQTATLPRGLGYGPAEINLLPLLGTQYSNLLVGVGALGLPGRYGELYPGGSGTPLPGISYNGATSINAISPLTYNKWWNYSGNYWAYCTPGNGGTLADAFGSPPDLNGIGAVGLDPAGQPLYASAGNWLANTPYDLDLSRYAGRGLPYNANYANPNPAGDDPFSAAELERLLRPFDRDAPGLPSRLAILGMPTPASPPDATSLLLQKRYAATTESWDVPCPAVALPMALRSQLAISGTVAPPQHILDLLTATLIANSGAPAMSYTGARSLAKSSAPQLIAPEMMAGLKLNLNQPLGLWANASLGTSAPNNGFVQFGSAPTATPIPSGNFYQPLSFGTASSGTASSNGGPNWPTAAASSPLFSPPTLTNTNAFSFDPAGNTISATFDDGAAVAIGVVGVGDLVLAAGDPARQRMARFLYVLMMIVRDAVGSVRKIRIPIRIPKRLSPVVQLSLTRGGSRSGQSTR